MSNIRKIVLKKLLEFKVISREPGKIELKSRAPENIYKQAQAYDEYLQRSILLLDGIYEVELDYNKGTSLILYDIERTDEEEVLHWINRIIEIGLENQEIIENYSNSDIRYLEILLEKQLKEEVKII